MNTTIRMIGQDFAEKVDFFFFLTDEEYYYY